MKLEAMAPSARYVGAMLALMFVVSGAVRAEPIFSFDAAPGKLPKTVVPISYSIELRPDAESLALPGVEVIDIEVREPTARLTLNAVNTTFAAVTVDDSLARRRCARCRGRDGDDDALLAKQGPQFRDQFIANFMTNFSDEGHAAELAASRRLRRLQAAG